MAQVSVSKQTSLDFWVVSKKEQEPPKTVWLVYQHKIDRLMKQTFQLYKDRQPTEEELATTFQEDELITIQPYLLWLYPSLNFEELVEVT